MDSITPTPHTATTPSVPLAVSDEQNTALLEDTLALLNNGVPVLGNTSAFSELGRWEEVLQASERPGLAKIRQELAQLHEQLNQPQPDSHSLAELLASLGNETAKVAEEASNGYSPALAQLAKVLIKLGSALSR